MTDTNHQGLILDQFTRQATPFSTASPITDANALRMIVEAADPRPGDTVLDVACGGGIVVCAFAPHVRQATGIDMTIKSFQTVTLRDNTFAACPACNGMHTWDKKDAWVQE